MVEEELEITKTQEDPDDNMTSNPGLPFNALLIQPHFLSIIQQKFKISFKHKLLDGPEEQIPAMNNVKDAIK